MEGRLGGRAERQARGIARLLNEQQHRPDSAQAQPKVDTPWQAAAPTPRNEVDALAALPAPMPALGIGVRQWIGIGLHIGQDARDLTARHIAIGIERRELARHAELIRAQNAGPLERALVALLDARPAPDLRPEIAPSRGGAAAVPAL